MYYAHLPGRGLLSVSGADAFSFLQGLVTNDVRKAEAGGLVYAALLTPQGKFLHDFLLLARGGAILLDTEKSRLGELRQRLMLYKLRSQVVIEELAEHGVVVIWGETTPSPDLPPQNGGKDPRLPELGWRMTGDVKEALSWCKAQGFTQAEESGYDALRIRLGVPDGSRDMLPDKTFLLECGLDALHGVDFTKGCYVGQEVTARTKYRGQVRKFLYRVEAAQELPEVGTPVHAGDTQAGQLRSHAGRQGLAILRAELVEKAEKEPIPLTAAGVRLSASLPDWLAQAQ